MARNLGFVEVQTLPYVLVSGWASGISVYATVLVTGLAGRFGGLESVPHAFERTDVLILAAILAACEFVADKIPFLDSAWDAVRVLLLAIHHPWAALVIALALLFFGVVLATLAIQRIRRGLRRLRNRAAATN